MANEDSTVRRIAWQELCPWLILFRCFRISISLRMLLPSALGAILTVTGWWMLASWMLPSPETGAPHPCPWTSTADLIPHSLDSQGHGPTSSTWAATLNLVPRQPWPVSHSASALARSPSDASMVVARSCDPMSGTWEQLSRPFRGIFSIYSPTAPGNDTAGRDLLFHLLCGLWCVAVWAFFGGGSTRSAALQLASGERLGLLGMGKFAARKWRAVFAAPLMPIGAALCITLALSILGLLLRLNLGWPLAAAVWPLVLLAGVFLAMLLLGLAFGWPLMFASLGVEGTDCFDAVSRAYAYVYQRPLHLLFYAAVATFLGLLGWVLVAYFTAAAVALSYWAVEWGTGGGRFVLDQGRMTFRFAGGEPLKHVGYLGGQAVFFWSSCLQILAVGYLYSYFWTASTAIYYLVRRDVDATELDEVLHETSPDEPCGSLPPLKVDESGAVVMSDRTSAPPTDSEA